MKHAIFLLTLILLLPQAANSTDQSRTISVQGYATKTLPAEYAEIHGELKIVSDNASTSYQKVTELVTKLASQFKAQQIKKENFTVSVVTQGAEYTWANNTRTTRGYFSACRLRLKVESIENMYRVHEILANYPEVRISMTSYGRNDEAELQITVLQEALLASQKKATAMAQTLNSSVGRVMNIQESGGVAAPVGRRVAQYADSGASAPEAVSTTGSVTISGSVRVDYALE